MSSPEQYDDEFCYTINSPPADQPEDAFVKFQDKRDENFSSSTSSEEDNGMGFDDFMDSLDLPPDLNGLEQERTDSPETQEQVMSLDKLVAELCVGQQDETEIKQEQEAILKLAKPSKPLGMRLMGCPFILKLYLAASSDAISMINWLPNGLQLVIDYLALQDHLISSSQIFRCRSVLQFTEKLKSEGFVRIHKEEVYARGLEAADLKPLLLYYQKQEFVRGDLDSLKALMEESLLKEKCPNGKTAEEAAVERAAKQAEFPVPLHLPSKSHIERMQQRGDKCCASISLRAPIQEARCRFRTLLDHLAATKVLQASAHLRENTAMKKGRPLDFSTFTSSSIKCVRPHDSVITLDPNKPLPEYAGYYGRVSPNKVSKFFSDFLPRYGNKTTGYKDIVLETTNKPSNFQQNLPIGLEYSDSDDNEPDDVQAPVSPVGQDSDIDCMPSTSAAAAAAMRSTGRKRSVDSVDDQDLEEAMQELCGGSTALKENVSSGSRGKAKPQQKPKSPKVTSRKRRAKSFDSSSSEDDEDEVSRKPKRAKKETAKDARKLQESTSEEAIEEDQDDLPKKRGPKTKAKMPKAASRKRHASPNKDEASPPRKRDKKGIQDSRQTKRNKKLEELEEEEVFVKKKLGQKKKQLSETDEENEDVEENEEADAEEYEEEDAAENDHAPQDEVENAEEDEYLEEDIAEGDVYLEDEIVEGDEIAEGDEYIEEDIAENYEQPEEDQTAEAGEHSQEELGEDEDYPEEELPEEEHPEKQHPEVDEEEEEPREDEDEGEQHRERENREEDEQPDEDVSADETQEHEVDEDIEDDEDAEEEDLDSEEDGDSTEDDDEDDAEENDDDDDDDDDDYSVQYRAAALQSDKPRRYDLRNSMRKSK
ncbi:hypothetical protein KR032_011895 [Drosophila birchii]|nr:hypothetical protein KR032_011895 [Drosophila birchii]